MVDVRREGAADRAAVRRLLVAAFGGRDEANLVDRLRRGLAASEAIALVAELDGAVVGHILFTRVSVESPDGDWSAMGLAPMAVHPDHQRRGIGTVLVNRGLEACLQEGHAIVFVLGHPGYYPRFGFERASAVGLGCEFDAPEEAFMVRELVPGALAGRTGTVRYRREFRVPGP